ncbi:flavodoxin [Pediococcus damnosus]|uniref:flavodoxin n=1 Tax=Pediococcus damnosus TaxID=51663 RepID=UPI001D04C768|nr:flavodoxin [Pediococcus damnosus]
MYFSVSGNTKAAALNLQQQLHADIYRLQPEKAYPDDYDSLVPVAQNEKDSQSHPKLREPLPDLSQYTKIYVGYPTWWSQPPMIIHSLFEQVDFRGKTVTAFATSGSTPLKDTLATMTNLVKNAGGTLVED